MAAYFGSFELGAFLWSLSKVEVCVYPKSGFQVHTPRSPGVKPPIKISRRKQSRRELFKGSTINNDRGTQREKYDKGLECILLSCIVQEPIMSQASFFNDSLHFQTYREIPIISPGFSLFKGFFTGLSYFRGSLFSEGLVLGGNFAFHNSNSPSALFSEGYLRLRCVCLCVLVCVCVCGGGGGGATYFREGLNRLSQYFKKGFLSLHSNCQAFYT